MLTSRAKLFPHTRMITVKDISSLGVLQGDRLPVSSSQVAASMKLKSPLISGTSGARIKFPGPREGVGGK